MTPKKYMSIAKSLTDTQHMELEPLCTANILNVRNTKFCGMYNATHTVPVPFRHLITVPSTGDKYYFQLYFENVSYIIQTVVLLLKPV